MNGLFSRIFFLTYYLTYYLYVIDYRDYTK